MLQRELYWGVDSPVSRIISLWCSRYKCIPMSENARDAIFSYAYLKSILDELVQPLTRQ